MRRQGVGRAGPRSELAMVAALAAATPVAAYVEETGTKDCGVFIGYVHARFNDVGKLGGPGPGSSTYTFTDGNWHVQERNGGYSGSWLARGTPDLDTSATFAGCRNYG
ncbi:MAG: hypothetical protein U0667_12865 [Chloroflexota bacterium]